MRGNTRRNRWIHKSGKVAEDENFFPEKHKKKSMIYKSRKVVQKINPFREKKQEDIYHSRQDKFKDQTPPMRGNTRRNRWIHKSGKVAEDENFFPEKHKKKS